MTHPRRGRSNLHLVVAVLSGIVVLLAVAIGVLLVRRAAKREAQAATPSATPTPSASPSASPTPSATPTPSTSPTPEGPSEAELIKRGEQDELEAAARQRLDSARIGLTQARRAVARRAAGRALAELLAVERVLGGVSELATEHTEHNTEAENQALLARRVLPQRDRLSEELLVLRAQAHRLRRTPQARRAARELLEAGLKRPGLSDAAKPRLQLELARLQADAGALPEAAALLEQVLQATPQAEVALLLAGLRLRAGDRERALAAAKRAEALIDPQDADGLAALGQLLLDLGAGARAQAAFARAERLSPQPSFALRIGLGRAKLAARDHPGALRVLTQAIEQNPRSPVGYRWRGEVSLALGGLAKAIKDFEVALARDPKHAPAQLGLGRALELQGDRDRARTHLRQATRSPETEVEARARLARHLLWRADPLWCAAAATSGAEAKREEHLVAANREAAAAAKLAPRDPRVVWIKRRLAGETPRPPQAYAREVPTLVADGLRLAALAERSGKEAYRREAEQAFSLAWVIDPAAKPAHQGFAELELAWGEPQLALRAARRAAKLESNGETQLLVGRLLGHLLPAEERDPAAALQAYAEARKHAQRLQIQLRIALAEARTQRARGDAHRAAARDALARGAASIPSDPTRLDAELAEASQLASLWRELCVALKDEAGQARAAKLQTKLQAASRARIERLLAAARKLRDARDYRGAIRRFDEVLKLDPKQASAYYDRGTCYLKVGNFVPGILDFSRSLELDPRRGDVVLNKVYQISYVVDLNRVIAELNRIVGSRPGVSYIVFLRGFFYVAATLGKSKKRTVKHAVKNGIADFDTTLSLNPKHVTALNYRAYLRTVQATRRPAGERRPLFEQALADLHRARQLDPANGSNRYLHAYLLMRRSEGQPAATVEKLHTEALRQLLAAFERGFQGAQRLKTEPAFAPILNAPELRPHLGR